MILGATLVAVLIPVIVIRLRRAGRTLDAIMAEHHERMTGAVAAAPLRSPGRHRRQGRRPRTVRTNAGYATHRRMSA